MHTSIEPYVLEAARRLGLQGTDDSVSQELQNLVRLSAPFSHPTMNRRYEGLVFLVTEDGLEAVGGVAESAMARRMAGSTVKLLCTTCCADGDFCGDCDSRGFFRMPDFVLCEGHILYSRLSQLD